MLIETNATPAIIELQSAGGSKPEDASKQEATSEAAPCPEGIKLAIIVAFLAASIFLVALDETIIATAVPQITDDFQSLSDIGWYGSAYLLTFCSFQLPYGKMFTFFSDKTVFLCALVIFEVGSVICATAQDSSVFIIGRAIAGLGSAGINAGYIIIIAASIPLERRPIFVASYSISYGTGTSIAPVIGGAFTTALTWRWCFWINLPFGAITIAAIMLFYRSRDTHAGAKQSFRSKLHQVDVSGTVMVLASTICLLLTLQWGGSKYAWNSWRIILLFALSGFFGAIFLLIQHLRQDNATLPPRIIKYRSVAASALFVFAAGGAMNVMDYYLPLYFQAIQGASALRSGVLVLPMILSKIFFSLVAGYGVAKLGYYTPFMIAGAVFISVASGLISTWSPSTPEAFWIGTQFLLGTGSGLGIQQAHTAAQTVLNDQDVPTGAVVIIFAQIFGGTIFLSVAQSVFQNQLQSQIQRMAPWLDPQEVIGAGATGVRTVVPPQALTVVEQAYSKALDSTYLVSVGLAALSFVGAAATEWKSIKKKRGTQED